MIGTLAYLAALSAPDIASSAADASSKLVEATGKRLAAGMIDEISARLKPTNGSLFGSAVGLLTGGASAAVDNLQEDITRRCRAVLTGAGVTIVDDEELTLLRDVAVAAATDGDVVAAVDKLKAFHRNRTSSSTSTEVAE